VRRRGGLVVATPGTVEVTWCDCDSARVEHCVVYVLLKENFSAYRTPSTACCTPRNSCQMVAC
jgi:hypothetical protein